MCCVMQRRNIFEYGVWNGINTPLWRIAKLSDDRLTFVLLTKSGRKSQKGAYSNISHTVFIIAKYIQKKNTFAYFTKSRAVCRLNATMYCMRMVPVRVPIPMNQSIHTSTYSFSIIYSYRLSTAP